MERLTTNVPQPDQRLATPAAPLRAQPLTQIRRALGNRAFGQAIQAKLTISRPGDEYEQEADRVADQVMRMPDDSTPAAVRSDGSPHISGLQRECAQCEEEEIQRQPMNGTMDEEEEEATLQAKAVPGHSPQVTPAVQAQIEGLRGGGEPLPESARAFFEPRFGYDFSHVRTHTGAHAAESARAVNALAFTVGPNVVFGAGRYEPNTDEGRNLLAHELTHVVQQTPSLSHKTPTIQRLSEEAGSTAPLSRTLIAEDSAEELAPGQMKKSEFLAELHTAVCNTAEEALAGTGRSTEGCPYFDYWFGYYSGQDCHHIERAIHKYAPEASSATTVSEYISLIVARVRGSVELWANTGEAPGAPEDLPSAMPEAASTAGAEDSGAENGNILFKGREGGAKDAGNPRALQAQLGSGQPLDSDVNSRMSSAFGYDFSRVRTHTDSQAAAISSDLNARAFTIGRDVAFGAGEYQPGTMIGDAILAHELAHVAQQGEANSSTGPMPSDGSLQNALEEDADTSAVGAVVSLWSATKGWLSDVAQNAMPRLKTGLKLQRCKGGKEKPPDASKITDATIEATAEYKAYMDPALQWQTTHNLTREEALLAYRLIVRTRSEGTTVNWPADAEKFMNLARKQLGALKEATGLKGKLYWEAVTPQMVEGQSPWTDFGKWLLEGGPEPDLTTGKVNCWEMVMFSAYRGNYTSKQRIEDIYKKGVSTNVPGTTSFPDTIEKELRRGNEYVLKPNDPDSPEPLPGDIVIFTKAANHAAISLGTKDSLGRHKIISHWPPPDGTYKVKETTIEELLAQMQPGNVVKFWSPAW